MQEKGREWDQGKAQREAFEHAILSVHLNREQIRFSLIFPLYESMEAAIQTPFGQ